MKFKATINILHLILTESGAEYGVYDIFLCNSRSPLLGKYTFREKYCSMKLERDVCYTEEEIILGILNNSFEIIREEEDFYSLCFIDGKIECGKISEDNTTLAEKMKLLNNYFLTSKYDKDDLIQQFTDYCNRNLSKLMEDFKPEEKK
mgnify:CR=1 FL=1